MFGFVSGQPSPGVARGACCDLRGRDECMTPLRFPVGAPLGLRLRVVAQCDTGTRTRRCLMVWHTVRLSAVSRFTSQRTVWE